MSKTKFTTVQGVTIYPIDYLANEELSDNDLSNLLDNEKRGLRYSLVIGMFKFIKSPKRNYQIIKSITSNKNWFKKTTWTTEQQNEYEQLVIKVYKNIYQYKELTAISLAQWFMSIYGLNIEGNNIDL
jgi:hypothetical protein